MKTIRISHSIDLPVTAGIAWTVIADYPRDPEWRTGVLSMTAEPPGPVDVGTTTVEQLRFGGKTYRNVGEIIAVEAGRTICWRTTEGADADGRRSITSLPDGNCTLTLELRVRPTGIERLVAPILARMLDRNMRQDLERLHRLLVDATRHTTRNDVHGAMSSVSTLGTERP